MFKRAVRRWKRSLKWIMALSLVLSLAMAVYTYRFEPDRYVAEYVFYALPADVTEDEEAPVRMGMLVKDYDHLLHDPDFRAQVMENTLSDGKTYLRACGTAEDHMVTIRAVGEDAQIVQGLANAAGEKLVAESDTRFGVSKTDVVSRAELPAEATLPNRPLRILLTFAAALIVLSVLAVLFGSRREPVGWLTPPERTSVPALGQVADFRSAKNKCLRALRKEKDGCTFFGSVNRLVREGVCQAALSLRACAGMGGGSIAVLGACAEDEAEALTVLFGQTLAREGFSVLMMEMNGADPQLGDLLGVRGQVDVLDCLADDRVLSQALLGTSTRNLHFIDCCHDAESVLHAGASEAFRVFVENALEIYDYVLISAPPTSFGSSAAAIGSAVDQTVLAATEGRYTDRELSGAAGLLARAAARVSGVVYTSVPKKLLRGLYEEDEREYRKVLNQAAGA